ncbi:tryptophan 7-halogenase [Caulobacter sp. UNC358MFTsu5.1]|uniref:tryptophan 7-halogenase n=1 Tax=Caulobacter sp. UNC358MFTsu5.1 TaxID=1449049 RepID=UPI0004A6FC4A|nr:tryptophan 7-halogenase [Caulobacter sp. UNC358MFTsu5.1]
MSAPVSIVVVGRDAALWLSACVLRAALRPAGVGVTAVELPTRLTPADVHASLPPLEALHGMLGLDEADVLRATRGAFSLGQNFADVSGATPAFFHAHGAYGAPIDNRDFFPFWLKARGLGLNVALDDFSLTAAAARQGRVLLPDEETEVFGRTDYGYHLPALAYAAALKGLAKRLGVELHQALSVAPTLDADGEIAALDLGEGRSVRGDLFVDATGGEALLMTALGVARDSGRGHFPADRVLRAQGPRFASLPPYADIRAWARGWVGLHPSQAATHVVQAYAGDLCTDDQALEMAGRISGLALADAVVSVSDPGRRVQAWSRNCVAVGEAACAFDPVHGVDLQAVQLGLVHLLPLFPVAADFDAERATYNATMREVYERLRDFQSAHYVANRYAKAPFWERARAAGVSEVLAHKIATFQARGDIPPSEHETFVADSWRALLTGHGVTPEAHAPMIDRTSPEVVKGEFRRILAFIKGQVLKQPTHDLYLESFC